MRAIRPRLFAFACMLALGICAPAPAAAAASRFSPIDRHHSSWTSKDGAPASIIAIAQTPDRWLWLASISGIYRFDGVRFERFRPPGTALPSQVWGMRLLRSGALWIGHRSGGASVWRDGVLRSFGVADGLPPSSIMDVEEDGDGRVWAATARGLYLFDGTRWAPPPAALQAPAGECTLLTDTALTMWVQCDGGAAALSRGAPAFARLAGPVGLGRLALAPDGTVWSVGGLRGDMAVLGGRAGTGALPDWPRPRTSGGAILFERDGRHAWVTRADGVMRAGPDGTGRVFGTAQGLSGGMPNCLFQDVEGNVWVGTENGLDRFRPALLSGVALPQIFNDSPAIAAGADGALWVGATRVAHPGVAAFEALPAEHEGKAVNAVLAAEPGGVWFGGHDGLWHEHGGRREKIPLPPTVRFMQFQALARGRDGALWMAARRAGLLRWHDGAWTQAGGHAALLGDARYVQADRRGRVWVGYQGGILRVLEEGTVRTYGPAQGLDVGELLQVLDGADGTWISGANGVVHFDGRRFTPLLGDGDEPIAGVSGMVRARGALWLNGTGGITVVGDAELARFVADGRHRVALRRLDDKDGLRGVATTFFPVPSALAGSDGTLWFATSAGLFWLRSDGGVANRLAPPVEIRALKVDGASLPLSAPGGTALPPNPGRVRIDYTALSLTMPERMRFLYRLDGVDRGWQDGGPERQAEYTDLGPGHYTFRVRASNNDGVWSEHDAVIGFAVTPAFHQTAPFRLLCGAAFTAAAWWLHRRRVRRIAGVARERAEAGLRERERIARELHDTVLQTVQGLMLQVDAACQQLPPDSPARNGIERSLRLAAQGVDEGRARVQGLRGNHAEEGGVQPELAQHVCALLRAELPAVPAVHVQVRGRQRRLRSGVFDELAVLAREAGRNAARHAGAATVSVEADYGDGDFVLAVRDDGRGMPPEVLQAGGRAGHWGLPGMRERAARVGATLALDSAPGAGTRVVVTIAAARAYVAP